MCDQEVESCDCVDEEMLPVLAFGGRVGRVLRWQQFKRTVCDQRRPLAALLPAFIYFRI